MIGIYVFLNVIFNYFNFVLKNVIKYQYLLKNIKTKKLKYKMLETFRKCGELS